MRLVLYFDMLCSQLIIHHLNRVRYEDRSARFYIVLNTFNSPECSLWEMIAELYIVNYLSKTFVSRDSIPSLKL